MSYAAIGAPDAPMVVLCHGLAAGSLQFTADAEHFAGLGYRVLLPDLRGHGRSTAPLEIGPDTYSIRTMADDMGAMLDHAGAASVHWVGNSLGGIVALDLIGREPQRFASLALFGTAFALNLPAVVSPVFPLLYGVLGRRLLSRVTAFNTTRHRPARPVIAAMAHAFDPKVGAAISAHVRRYDLLDNALGFAGPVLVLVGGHDTAVNLALRPTLRRITPRPNWTVTELPLGGHCSNLDATQAWRRELTTFWTAA
ncbi:alpha/beta fold hydrolase [Devosia sp. SL43]|uniref:alpha/beta fold hydrolase n=1 Tax=Devosia sp. SL43 TaxID=2806348 RepID=UPI001F347743|nr:alpha/beta hydrolase [Devosia sp. SL43]UJW84603.1 alpha/beta fold hydrolase [Devosia sp. SL43]